MRGSEFPGTACPLGRLVPPRTPSRAFRETLGTKAQQGILAGYQMRTAHEGDKSCLGWELRLFRNADLRAEPTWDAQHIGVPSVVGRRELPADGLIKFPTKDHHDKVNMDVLNSC